MSTATVAVKSASDVAKFFLCRVDSAAGDTISNLKLQKLVYYAQAWSLALRDKPLFKEAIHAWQHGPVVPALYHEYKSYGYGAIDVPPNCPIIQGGFDPEERGILETVWRTYGSLSGRQLEDLTHSEDPWMSARGGIPAYQPSDAVIDHDSLKTYYKSLIK